MTNNTAARKAGLTSINQVAAFQMLVTGPETMIAIATRLGISTAAVTDIADKLEKLGLIERVRGRQDRRSVWLKLTEKGKTLAASLATPKTVAP
jgi:DNA-binding MarR family transcriptional regulator